MFSNSHSHPKKPIIIFYVYVYWEFQLVLCCYLFRLRGVWRARPQVLKGVFYMTDQDPSSTSSRISVRASQIILKTVSPLYSIPYPIPRYMFFYTILSYYFFTQQSLMTSPFQRRSPYISVFDVFSYPASTIFFKLGLYDNPSHLTFPSGLTEFVRELTPALTSMHTVV